MWWPFKRRTVYVNHELTDEERELGVEKRRMNAEKRRLEHAIEVAELRIQLQELEEALGEDDDDGFDVETLFKNVILSKLVNPSASSGDWFGMPERSENAQPPPTTTTPPTDDQLREFIKQIPTRYLTIARMLPDSKLVQFVMEKGGVDEETAKRTVAIFRTEKF